MFLKDDGVSADWEAWVSTARTLDPLAFALTSSPHLLMATIPKRVEDRINAALRRFTPVLVAQRDRDVSEADTVTVVKDLLSDLFGYDKYAEVTSEHAIRGTYCDLAIRIDGKLRLMLEVKSIGTTLNEKHVKQAVDYATNQGLDWVVLTNGIRWLLYRVSFKKPIEAKVVAEFDLLTLNRTSEADLEKIYILTREGLVKGAVVEFTEKQSATSKFLVAAVLVNDADVLNCIRRELRRITDIMVPTEVIADVLRHEVIKRETLEGDDSQSATRLVLKGDRKSKVASEASPAAVASSPEAPEDLTQNTPSS